MAKQSSNKGYAKSPMYGKHDMVNCWDCGEEMKHTKTCFRIKKIYIKRFFEALFSFLLFIIFSCESLRPLFFIRELFSFLLFIII